MVKNKTNKKVLILLVIVVLGLALILNKIQIGGKEVDVGDTFLAIAHPGCDPLPIEEVLDADTYYCQADECDVRGVLNCDVETGESRVSLRCADNNWFAWNKGNEGTNILTYFEFTQVTIGTGAGQIVATCPDGKPVIRSLTSCDYVIPRSGSYYCYSEASIPDTNYVQVTPLSGYESREVTAKGSGYSCEWNFCPNPDPFFNYCDKISTDDTAWSTSSDTYYQLPKDSYVTFRPRSSSGLSLASENSKIVVEPWDCTCKDECSDEDKYCNPESANNDFFCSGSNNNALAACQASGCNNCVTMGYESHRGADCRYKYKVECQQPQDNSRYQTCDGQDADGCDSFSTFQTCSAGLVCKPYEGLIGEEGLGDCICADDPCVPGEHECSDTSYRVCRKNSQGCNFWGTWQTCPADKVAQQCNPDTFSDDYCIEPQPIVCDDYDKRCNSETEIQECVRDTNSVRYWSDARPCGVFTNEPSYCIGNEPNAACGCDNEQCGSVSEKQCAGGGSNAYKKCIRGSDGCFGWEVSATGSCDDLICSNNQCVDCADGDVCTTDYVENNVCRHSQITDCCLIDDDCADGFTCSNNQCTPLVGFCVDNTDCSNPYVCDTASNNCVCPNDGLFCSSTDSGLTRCTSNTEIEICRQDSVTKCYKWQYSETCGSPEVCIEHSPANCEIPGDMYITSDSNVPINQPLEFGVGVKESVGDIAGFRVDGVISDSVGMTLTSSTCLLSKNLLSNDYSCTLRFPQGLNQKGEYRLETQLNLQQQYGVTLGSTHDFKVFKGVAVNIMSDTVVYTGLEDPGIARLTVKDENNQLVPMCSQSSAGECFDRWIVQPMVAGSEVGYSFEQTGRAGEVIVNYAIPSTGSVSLKAWTEGGELVSVSDERTDIVAQTPSIILEEDTPAQVNFGNNIRFDFETYAPSNDPEVDKVPLDVDTNRIFIDVKKPNGAEMRLSPSRVGKGKYYFALDMPKGEGDVYSFTITASHSTWPQYTSREKIVAVVSSTIDPLPGTDWLMFVVVGMVIILVIVLVVTKISQRRKK